MREGGSYDEGRRKGKTSPGTQNAQTGNNASARVRERSELWAYGKNQAQGHGGSSENGPGGKGVEALYTTSER